MVLMLILKEQRLSPQVKVGEQSSCVKTVMGLALGRL